MPSSWRTFPVTYRGLPWSCPMGAAAHSGRRVDRSHITDWPRWGCLRLYWTERRLSWCAIVFVPRSSFGRLFVRRSTALHAQRLIATSTLSLGWRVVRKFWPPRQTGSRQRCAHCPRKISRQRNRSMLLVSFAARSPRPRCAHFGVARVRRLSLIHI